MNLISEFFIFISSVFSIFIPHGNQAVVFNSPVWGYEAAKITFATSSKKKPTPTPAANSDMLGKAALSALEGADGDYYIYIKNLKTGEHFGLSENEILQSGSLYKSWLGVEAFKLIESGKLDEDQVLSDSVERLNDWAGLDDESADLTEGIVTLSVSNAIGQMIKVSNNYAAFLLTKKVGESKVRSFLSDNNLEYSFFERPPRVSPADMGKFFEGIYKDQYLNSTDSAKIKNFLAANVFTDRIVKYLPDEVRVEHKTGEINSYKHDCGIVYPTAGNDYIICVMSNSDYPSGAAERIAKVSKAVYDYFENKENNPDI